MIPNATESLCRIVISNATDCLLRVEIPKPTECLLRVVIPKTLHPSSLVLMFSPVYGADELRQVEIFMLDSNAMDSHPKSLVLGLGP